MSTSDTAQSIGSTLVFSGAAWFSDIVSAALGNLQLAFAALWSGPQALASGVIAGIATAVLGVIDFVFGADILAHTVAGFTVFLGAQAIVSVFTLCVFYAIVMISPKGTYSLSDCLIAAGVCLLETMPFFTTFVFWGSFAVYLRRKELSGVIEKASGVLGSTSSVGKFVKGAAQVFGR